MQITTTPRTRSSLKAGWMICKDFTKTLKIESKLLMSFCRLETVPGLTLQSKYISYWYFGLPNNCHPFSWTPFKEVKWAEIKELALKFWMNWLKWCSRDLLLTWSPSSCFWLAITSSLITTHCCHFRNMLITFPESLSVTPKFWLFGHNISLLGILSAGLVGHFSCKSVPPRSHPVAWKST